MSCGSWGSRRERKRFFLLPLHFFLFKSLTMYFAQCCAKTFPCFWRFLALGLTPHSSANIFYSNTTKETKSLRNDRCKNNFILNLLTRIFKHPLIKASLIQPILCLFMNSEGRPVYLCMPNQWDRQAHFDFSNFPTLLRISGMSQQVSGKRKLQLKRARGRSGRNNYCFLLRMTGLPLFGPSTCIHLKTLNLKVSQPCDILRIYTVVTPQSSLILPHW